jgi:hypothetical protein
MSLAGCGLLPLIVVNPEVCGCAKKIIENRPGVARHAKLTITKQ